MSAAAYLLQTNMMNGGCMRITTVRVVPISVAIGFAHVGVANTVDGGVASDDGRARVAAISPEAQSTSSADSKRAGESGRSRSIEEIVVTAQKREERLQDVPISISVLGGESLDSSSVSGVIDALKAVPGIASYSIGSGTTGGGTMLTMRGVGASNDFANGSSPIGYYLDSVPFGLIKSAFAPDQSAYDMDRVEVLRGPQGTLYGASSENGLIRVLTKEPDLNEFELKARTTVSETDFSDDLSYRGDAAINVPLIEGKLAARAVAGYESSAGWIDAPLGRDVNDSTRKNLRLKIGAKPIESLSLGASVWSSRIESGSAGGSFEDKTSNLVSSDPILNNYDLYGFKVGYDFEALSIESATGYIDYEQSGGQELTPQGLPGFRLGSVLTSKVFSEELIFRSAADRAWKWTAGAFYRTGKDRLSQYLAFPPSTPPIPNFVLDNDDESESYAFFGEVGHKFLGDKFEWTLGARYFHDTVSDVNNLTGGSLEDSFTSTTPRAVLTWYPSEDLTAYATYSEGFRSGFPQYVGLVPVGFPALKPDKLKNYEVGIKGSVLERRLSFDTSLYFIDWQDVQQTISVLFNDVDVAAPINGESASGLGVDVSLSAVLTESWNAGVTASWNDLAMDADVNVPLRVGPATYTTASLFKEGDRLKLSAEETYGVWTNYVRPVGQSGYTLGFSASAYYVSSLENRAAGVPVAIVVAGESILMGRADLTLTFPGQWSATFFVDNIGNEYGPITGAIIPNGDAPRVRPRTVGLQLDFGF